MARFAIFGDSYVERLGRSGYSDLRLPGSPTVQYFGKGGLKLHDADKHPVWTAMKEYRPTHVFFHCGGNSFSSRTTPSNIVEKIEKMVSELEAETVYVGEILPRGEVRRQTGLSLAEWEAFRRDVNGLLRESFQRNCKTFYVMSTFRPDGRLSQFYHKDKVHMSEPAGLIKYRKIIRQAFLH